MKHFFKCVQADVGLFHVVNDNAQAENKREMCYRIENDEPFLIFAVEYTDHID